MASRKKPKSTQRLRRWSRRVAWVLLGLIAASFALVLPLKWFHPVTTAFILQDGAVTEQPLWVAWPDIALNAKLAVVAAEDQRFADHFGLDFAAIQKAVDEQDQRGYLRGASTISQQTAKNLFLWPGRSFLRKGLEAWLTLVVETCLSKQRILEIYLNVAEFGPGIYGVGAASLHYFGRPPALLSRQQAALLAAVLPNPRQLRVDAPSAHVRERQQWILTQMDRLDREGWITRVQ